VVDYTSGRTSENVSDKRTNVAGQGLNAHGNRDPERIKRNIKRMVDQGAPEADIDAYLAGEGVTLDELRGGRTAPAPTPDGDDPRAQWTPEEKQAYQERRELLERVPELKPGYGARIAHSASLGAADEISAGLQTAIETPAAILRGDREGIRARFNRHMAEQAANLDVMHEETDGAGGVAADIAGGVAMGIPKAAAAGGNAMLQAATAPPARGQLTKDLIKYGAGFGGAHAFANAEGGVVDRLAYVPQGMVEGAGGALVFGHALNKGLNAMAKYRGNRAQRAQEAQGRADEMRAAGISDPLPAAVSGNAMAEAATRGAGSTFVGGPIRSKAAENIGQLQGRFNAMLDAQTGGRSSDELGREAQAVLEHQLTGRSIPAEEVASLTPEQLQDITGGPLPQDYRPAPVRVEPVTPRDVAEVTPDEYLESLREGVQPVRPNYPPDEVPRELRLEDFAPAAEAPTVNPEIAAKRAEVQQLRARTEPAVKALMDDEAQLTEAIKRAGFEIEEHSGGAFSFRTRGLWGEMDDPIDYHPTGAPDTYAERNYEAMAHKAFGKGSFRREAKARPYQDAAEAIRARRKVTDELAARYAATRQRRAEVEAASKRVAQLEKEVTRLEAADVEAAKKARATAEERQRAEFQRAVEAENERVRQVNATNRALAEDQAAAETERLRQAAVEPEREKAASAARARTNQLRREAEEEARRETAKRQKEAEEAQAREFEERRARAPARKPLGSNRDLTYVTEADAGYEMGRRITPRVQRNPLGAPGRPTETSRLIDALATEARGSGRLPGFKGRAFDADGNLHPDVAKIMREDFGNEVADRLIYLAERRARGQLPPGIRGLHDIRTLIGRELADAGKGRAPGMPRGPSEAALSRLYKAFSRDIDDIRNVGPGGAQATRMRHEQDEDYASLIENLKRPLGKLFGKDVTPVQALDKLVAGAKRGDLELLRPYMRVMTEKDDPLKAAATIVQHVVRGEKDFAGIMKALGEIRPETRDVLFAGKDGSEYRAALERLEAVGRRLEPFANLAKKQGGVLKQAVHPSTLVTAAAFYHQFWPALVTTAGVAAASKFLASPRYLNWLTKVPKVLGNGLQGKEALRHLSRLTAITATDAEFGEPIMQAIGSMFMGRAQASEDDTEIEAEGPGPEPDEQEVDPDEDEPEHHSHRQNRNKRTGQFMEGMRDARPEVQSMVEQNIEFIKRNAGREISPDEEAWLRHGFATYGDGWDPGYEDEYPGPGNWGGSAPMQGNAMAQGRAGAMPFNRGTHPRHQNAMRAFGGR